MAISYIGNGGLAANTGAITPALPAGLEEGDLLVLALETANEAITAPAGWTQVPASPQGSGTPGAAAATRITVFTRFYTSGLADPTTSDSGNHQIGVVTAWRGVDSIEASAGNAPAASNPVALPDISTTTAGCTILYIVAGDRDLNSTDTQFASWSSPDLDGGAVTEVFDQFSAQGQGGGLGIAYGALSGSGTVDGASWSWGSGSHLGAALALALVPASGGGSATVSPASATHAHAASAASVSALAQVVPAGSSHGHTAGVGSVTAQATVSPAGAVLAHSAGSPGVSQSSGAVSPAGAVHAHSAGQASVSAASGAVAPASSVHGHSAGSPSASSLATVSPAGAVHGHSSVYPFSFVLPPAARTLVARRRGGITADSESPRTILAGGAASRQVSAPARAHVTAVARV